MESSRLVVLVMESHSRLREERFSLECRIIASSFRDAVQPHSHFNVSLMALGSCRVESRLNIGVKRGET